MFVVIISMNRNPHFRQNFRAIVAGGGTGRDTSFLAEQLNHTNAEIVYMDFSRNSMRIAQLRTKMRKCSNIVWVTSWIEATTFLGLQSFDLFISTGVLHHLKDPQKGLRVLQDAQSQSGGALLMVYGKLGRAGIYQIQELLRYVNKGEESIGNEVENAKVVLAALPYENWFNTYRSGDHITMGDVGIYDLLLHKRDVSYDIREAFNFVEMGGYNFVGFYLPELNIPLTLNPRILGLQLIELFLKKPMSSQQYIGDILKGDMNQNGMFISKQKNSEAKLSIEENSIYTYGSPLGLRNILYETSCHRQVGNESFVIAKLLRTRGRKNALTKTFNGLGPDLDPIGEIAFPLTELSKFIISSLSKKPLKPISLDSLLLKFKRQSQIEYNTHNLRLQLDDIFWYFKMTGMFLLKKTPILAFPKTGERNLFSVLC